MKQTAKKKLELYGEGLYRVFWTDGGQSLAAVGKFETGQFWYKLTDWKHGTIKEVNWDGIEDVEVIANR